MPETSQVSLEEIKTLSSKELKTAFADLYGQAPPAHASRGFISANVAYRIQELEHGGLSDKTKATLTKIAKELELNPAYSPIPGRVAKPGTRLLREWQGVIHEVTVLENGFDYKGERYRSLSRIAFEITGTNWSGPAFFGLKDCKKGKYDDGSTKEHSLRHLHPQILRGRFGTRLQ